MKLILALLVLTMLALAGSRRILFDRHIPLGARLIFLTGVEFIVVGYLLGPQFLDLIDKTTLTRIEPITAVCLGWVGFMFGLQFERRTLKSLPSHYFTAAMVQSAFTLVMVLAAFLPLLLLTHALSFREALPAAAALAAAAACSGQAGLAIVQRRFPKSNRQVLSLLRYLAGLDGLPALLLFGILTCFCAFRPGILGMAAGLPRLALGLALAGLVGLLLYSLAREKTRQSDLLLLLLGTAAVIGGVANQVDVSVLFLSLLAGMVVANISPLSVRMSEMLHGGEHFIYMILLVVAGASWRAPTVFTFLLAGVYIAVRLASKVSGTYLATRSIASHLPVPRHVGLGLGSQAGMALAIVIDYHHMSAHVLSDVVLTVVILGIILSELFGPVLIVSVVGGRRVERAGDEP